MKKLLLALLTAPVFFVSCVSTRKFKAAETEYAELQTNYVQIQTDLSDVQGLQQKCRVKNRT